MAPTLIMNTCTLRQLWVPLSLTSTVRSYYLSFDGNKRLLFMKCLPLTIHFFMLFIYFHTNLSYVRSCYPVVTQDSKESVCNPGDPGSIPGLGRSSGEGNGHPLQYSCLENSTGREAWWAIVYGVIKSQT